MSLAHASDTVSNYRYREDSHTGLEAGIGLWDKEPQWPSLPEHGLKRYVCVCVCVHAWVYTCTRAHACVYVCVHVCVLWLGTSPWVCWSKDFVFSSLISILSILENPGILDSFIRVGLSIFHVLIFLFKNLTSLIKVFNIHRNLEHWKRWMEYFL